MNRYAISLLVLLTFAFAVVPAARTEESSWPFGDVSQKEAMVGLLRHRLFVDGVFGAMPKGVHLFLDYEDGKEMPEDGWLMVSLREHHAPDSGFDPNVSPAIEHFRVRMSDGAIEWMNVVEGADYEPWVNFLRSRRGE